MADFCSCPFLNHPPSTIHYPRVRKDALSTIHYPPSTRPTGRSVHYPRVRQDALFTIHASDRTLPPLFTATLLPLCLALALSLALSPHWVWYNVGQQEISSRGEAGCHSRMAMRREIGTNRNAAESTYSHKHCWSVWLCAAGAGWVWPVNPFPMVGNLPVLL